MAGCTVSLLSSFQHFGRDWKRQPVGIAFGDTCPSSSANSSIFVNVCTLCRMTLCYVYLCAAMRHWSAAPTSRYVDNGLALICYFGMVWSLDSTTPPSAFGFSISAIWLFDRHIGTLSRGELMNSPRVCVCVCVCVLLRIDYVVMNEYRVVNVHVFGGERRCGVMCLLPSHIPILSASFSLSLCTFRHNSYPLPNCASRGSAHGSSPSRLRSMRSQS